MSQAPRGNNVIGEAVINIRAQGAEQVASETSRAQASVENLGTSQGKTAGAIGRSVEGIKEFGRTAVGAFTRAIAVVGGFVSILGAAYSAGRALSDAIGGVDKKWEDFQKKLAKGTPQENLAAAREEMLALQNLLADAANTLPADSIAGQLVEKKAKEYVATLQKIIDDSQALIAAKQSRQDTDLENERLRKAAETEAVRARMTESRIADEVASAMGAEQQLRRERAKSLAEVAGLGINDAERTRLAALVEYVFALRKQKLDAENAEQERATAERIKKEYRDRGEAQKKLDRAMKDAVSDFERQMDAATARMAGGLGASMDRMVVILEDIYRSMPRGGF